MKTIIYTPFGWRFQRGKTVHTTVYVIDLHVRMEKQGNRLKPESCVSYEEVVKGINGSSIVRKGERSVKGKRNTLRRKDGYR